MKFALIFYVCVQLSLAAVRNTYEGWKVYRIWPHTDGLVEDLGSLYENTLNLDYWTVLREPNQPVDVAVAEIAHPSVENILYMLNITHRTEIEHLYKSLNKEINDMKNAPVPEKGEINFSNYHRYNTIMLYLENLQKKFADLVQVENLGTTYEGRDIKVVKISTKNSDEKPAILLEAGLSPREWIGPAQVLYIIEYLLNDSNRHLIRDVDWLIIPVANPDGYEYSHTIQRLWRKNRAKQSPKTFGVYLNRNFDVDWGKSLSKDDPESWNFHGLKPFSEPETLAIKNLIEDHSQRIQLYLSFQSFGPTILHPYGFTRDRPENIKLHKYLAEKASVSIAEQFPETVYRTRSSSGKTYLFSGSSIDWAVNKIGIPLGYVVELPAPGFLGFDFPINKIENVVKEFIPGLEVFHDFVKTSFYNPEQVDRDNIDLIVIETDEDVIEKEINGPEVQYLGSTIEPVDEIIAENEDNSRSSHIVNDEL